jgi:hypothetical protein
MANVPSALSSASGLPASITAGVTTGEVADTVTIYNAVKAILDEWPKITAHEYTVEEYGGGTGKTGAENSTAINAAITAANTAGGGVVKFGSGTYNVADPAPADGHGSAAIQMKRNVVLRGEGMWSTIVKISNDGGLVYHLSTTDTINVGEYEGVEDLTLWGYGDRNQTMGGDGTRTLRLRADMCWATRVRTIYARQMGITLDANGPRGALVNECRLEKTYRDAINCTGSTRATIVDNFISETADDAIAYHIASGMPLGTIVSQQAVVVGNRIEKSFGIKLLGASNASIIGNSGRFLYGYGVEVAYDETFNEGNKDMLGVVIANNSFLDIMNADLVDPTEPEFGNLGCGIFLHSPPPSQGSGGTQIAYTPGVVTAGTGTASVGTNQPTANHWNTLGPPSTGTWATVVANNTLMQTLSGGTNFSDYGFGLIWTRDGAVDNPYAGNIGIKYAGSVENVGISLRQGAIRDVLITGNKMVGFTEGVSAQNWPVMPRVTVKNNSFVRVNRGVSLLGGASGVPKIHALVDGNEFDLDPIFEATTRVQATPGNNATFTGAWNITDGGLSSSAVWTDQIEGITITNNHIRNAGRVFTDNLDLCILDGNVIYTDPTVTPEDPSAWLGVPVPNDPVLRSSRIVSTVCDPRLATYNQIRATAKRSDRPLAQRKSADQTFTGTTLVAITGLYFICEANTDYTVDAMLVISGSATTATPKIEVQGVTFAGAALAAPTLLHLVRDSQTSVTAWATNTITGYVTGTGGTVSTLAAAATNYQIRVRGIFRNSGGRGLLRFFAGVGGAGTLTIRAGSTLTVS